MEILDSEACSAQAPFPVEVQETDHVIWSETYGQLKGLF